jgi:tRNA pseudouridine38-40 synthase
MARYKLVLAYDGTEFWGSQRQSKRRTVQGELERALAALGQPEARVLMAGRTDAGVHALGQVASVDIDWKHGVAALRDALNAALPGDLAVRRADLASEDFHPRFDAKARRYLYSIFQAAVRDPLRERTAWRVWPEFDPGELEATSRRFLGRHDFGLFGSASRKGGSTVRTVQVSTWKQTADGLQYDVVAEGFLYRMVRRMVFLQVRVAQGRIPTAVLDEVLGKGRECKISAGLAPAAGLMLAEVQY